MSCVNVQYIDGDECIGASLPKINGNFAALSAAVCDLSGFNVVDSPTIDLNWNASTRTLSADVKDASVTNAKIAFDGGSFCFRNKVINGGMEIDQRKAGAMHTITAAAPQVYSLDRWYGFASGASTTHQRIAITNIPRLSYALRITGAAGNINTWAAQRIESSTSSSLAGLSATLSFYAASNNLTQLQVAWGRPGSFTPDDWSLTPTPPVSTGSQNFSITSTLTRYQATFIVPQEARRGFYIQFHSGSLLAGQTIDIAGVQLEEGPTATPFEQRPIGTELALCQRYYQFENSRYHVFPAGPYSEASHDIRITPMRTSPATTITILGSARLGTYGSPLFSGAAEKLRFNADHDAATTSAGYVNYSWTADAEL